MLSDVQYSIRHKRTETRADAYKRGGAVGECMLVGMVGEGRKLRVERLLYRPALALGNGPRRLEIYFPLATFIKPPRPISLFFHLDGLHIARLTQHAACGLALLGKRCFANAL